ncbi:hypothetical protein JHU04_000571 [Brenneria sp. 4F2]|nr:hypothetical protein [Brenneria bubanii]
MILSLTVNSTVWPTNIAHMKNICHIAAMVIAFTPIFSQATRKKQR